MSKSSAPASSIDVSHRMSRQRTKDTAPEVMLRRELHRRGRRFRVHMRPEPTLKRTPDIVFTGARVVIFVDGCFWHSCPEHGTRPKANAEWWAAKLESNRARDRDTDERFRELGWIVVHVWEHMGDREAADLVEQFLRTRVKVHNDRRALTPSPSQPS